MIIGGTAGIGREIAMQLIRRGERVVITGRELDRTQAAAASIGTTCSGVCVDLSQPSGIARQLASIGPVRRLVITAAEDYDNAIIDFNVDLAGKVAAIKLVGYPETVHALSDRLVPRAAVVLFGGMAMSRPYPGSTMVTATNAAVAGLVRALASQLAPTRVNGIHPAAVGDTARWEGEDVRSIASRTPIGRLVTAGEVAQAVLFLLDNAAINAVNLTVDGGASVW